MSQSSQRDHGPFSSPDLRRPPLPSASANPVGKNPWESDMLDQVAVQRLLLEGIYRRAGYQAKAIQKIADQAEVQSRLLRDMRTYLLFGIVVPTVGMLAALIIVAIVYVRSLMQ